MQILKLFPWFFSSNTRTISWNCQNFTTRWAGELKKWQNATVKVFPKSLDSTRTWFSLYKSIQHIFQLLCCLQLNFNTSLAEFRDLKLDYYWILLFEPFLNIFQAFWILQPKSSISSIPFKDLRTREHQRKTPKKRLNQAHNFISKKYAT